MSARLSGYPDRLVATPWLAVLGFLAVSQTAHLVEHVAQMVQIHVLHLGGANAQGIVGQLNIEWVHFIWNTWVIIAVLVLLSPFGANRWLRLTAVLSGWHEVEHVFIFWGYWQTGIAGLPGLLAQGGAIAGGLPISRPDLHFLYNLIETIPLILGFLWQVQRVVPGPPHCSGVRVGGTTAASVRR
jgi:hypothetical protein